MSDEIKMKEIGRHPDFKGDGIAGWLNTDKNGKPYFNIKMVGHDYVKMFKNEPKEKDGFQNADKV